MRNRPGLLVIGVCQASHLARVLKAIPNVAMRFNVEAVEICADPLTGEHRRPAPEALETCQCAYFQLGVTDTLPDYLAQLVGQAKSKRFPVLNCQALWPAHTELYPRRPEPGLPWGRFPYCDRVLLDLLETGPSDDRIVDEYMALDLARMFDLDRLVEMWHYRIEELDRSCDVPMAEIQWREWKDARHYWAVSHPTNHLLGSVLRKLLPGTAGWVPEKEIAAALRAHEFDEFMTPIHPSVARHFGLKWYSPDDLYKWPGGPFTIRQWALEHVRYTRRALSQPG